DRGDLTRASYSWSVFRLRGGRSRLTGVRFAGFLLARRPLPNGGVFKCRGADVVRSGSDSPVPKMPPAQYSQEWMRAAAAVWASSSSSERHVLVSDVGGGSTQVTPKSPSSSELARMGSAVFRSSASICEPSRDCSLRVGKRSSCHVSSAQFS